MFKVSKSAYKISPSGGDQDCEEGDETLIDPCSSSESVGLEHYQHNFFSEMPVQSSLYQMNTNSPEGLSQDVMTPRMLGNSLKVLSRPKLNFSSYANNTADFQYDSKATEILTDFAYFFELKTNPEKLHDFEVLTCEVVGQYDHDQALLRVLKSYGWNGKSFRPTDSSIVDINSLLQSLNNLYLANRLPQENQVLKISQESEVESLIAFLPNILLRCFDSQLDVSQIDVMSASFEGVVMLADISGFSKFSAQMCSQGVKGLNDLHMATSELLGHFIKLIYSFGGDVVTFAGDALICVFLDEDEEQHSCCARAMACALHLVEYSSFNLSAHIAISYGEMTLGILGGLNDEWIHLLNGPCVSSLKDCINDAGSKEIVATPLFHRKLKEFLTGNIVVSDDVETSGIVSSMTSSGNFCIEEFSSRESLQNLSLVKSNTSRIADSLHDANSLIPTLARMFVPRPVLSAVYSGSLDKIAELRQVVTIFAALDSYSPETHADPLSLQPFFNIVQEGLFKCGGYLRQFIIDEKSCCAIAMWGVPQFSYHNNSLRGLYCAAMIHDGAMNIGLNVSIGMTTGYGYCSDIGSPLRRDYVVISHAVNMAARLMGKANGRILIDEGSQSQLSNTVKSMLHPGESLHLKGAPEPVIPYVYEGIEIFTVNILQDAKDSTGLLRSHLRSVLGSSLDRLSNHVVRAVTITSERSPSKGDMLNKSPLRNAPQRFDPFRLSFSKTSVSAVRHHIFDEEMSMNIVSRRHAATEDRQDDSFEMHLNRVTSSMSLGAFTIQRAESNNTIKVDRCHPLNAKDGPALLTNCTVIMGMPGYGKSTAATFFETSARAQNLDVIRIKANPGDEGIPYQIVRKLYVEIVGASNFQGLEQQMKIVTSTVKSAYSSSNSQLANELTIETAVSIMMTILAINWSEPVDTVTSPVGDEKSTTNTHSASSHNLAALRSDSGIIAQRDKREKSKSVPLNDPTFCTVFSSMLRRNKGTVLIIDDVHNCDELSWMELSKILSADRSLLSILLTMRKPEVAHVGSKKTSVDLTSTVSSMVSTAGSMTAQLASKLGFNQSPGGFKSSPKKKSHGNVLSKSFLSESHRWAAAGNCDSVDGSSKQSISSKIIKKIRKVSQYSLSLASTIFPLAEGFQSSSVLLSTSITTSSGEETKFVIHSDSNYFTVRGAKFRPHASFIDLMGHANTQIIEITPLSSDELLSMMKTNLADIEASPDLLQLVMDTSGGNTFWVKSILKLIKEEGVEAFRKTMTRHDSNQNSLRIIIINQLDKFSAELQVIVKHASIIGLQFIYSTLISILPKKLQVELRAQLDLLQLNGIIYCIEDGQDPMYAFQNALIRNTVYDLSSLSDASTIHFSVARHIEAVHKNNLRNQYGSLSYHYRNTMNYRAYAFKFSVKAADYSLRVGAFNDGLCFLQIAEPLAKYELEEKILRDVVVASIDEIQSRYQISSGPSGTQRRASIAVLLFGSDKSFPEVASLLEEYNQLLKRLVDRIKGREIGKLDANSWGSMNSLSASTSDKKIKLKPQSERTPSAGKPVNASKVTETIASIRFRGQINHKSIRSAGKLAGRDGDDHGDDKDDDNVDGEDDEEGADRDMAMVAPKRPKIVNPPRMDQLKWQASFVASKRQQQEKKQSAISCSLM